MDRIRKKTWEEKTAIVRDCIERCRQAENFTKDFYKNLFFLKPKLKDYFKETDWEHQEKALNFALEDLACFWGDDELKKHHRSQILRISETHSKKNMNIHPHEYYYWIDALILTIKSHDRLWYDDQEYYLRECLFFPISFIISRYHSS